MSAGRAPLEKVVVPAATVYLAQRAATLDAGAVEHVYWWLARSVGSTVTNNAEYCHDVCRLLCSLAAQVRGGAVPTVLPHRVEISAAAAPDSMATHAGLHAGLGNPDAADAYRYALFACRQERAHARLGNAPEPLEAVPQEHGCRLLKVLLAYAAECQFKKTGDRHLHLQVRLLVSPWCTSPFGPHESPFPQCAAAYGDAANDTLRPVIDRHPVDIMAEMLAEYRDKTQLPGMHAGAARWCAVACVLIEELCGLPPVVYINDDVGLIAPAQPAVAILNGTGYAYGDRCVGIATGVGAFKTGAGVVDTLLVFLDALVQRADSPAGARHLLALCQLGLDGLTGPNPFSKYLSPKPSQ